MAVTCVFAFFPESGYSEVAVTCVFTSFPDRGGCYLLFASFHESGHLDSKMAVTCVFASFPEAELGCSEMALTCVLLWVFVCFRYTLCTTPEAVGTLLIAFFPKFPIFSTDNKSVLLHLSLFWIVNGLLST